MTKTENIEHQVQEKLNFIYGPEVGGQTWDKLAGLLGKYQNLQSLSPQVAPAERLTEQDVMLITYGDQVQSGSATHLQTLHRFLNQHLQGTINTVHILPFYPYTSDDGFSVVDYKQVDPALGSWEDVEKLHTDFRIMFDAVVNHISASSAWFQGFLKGEDKYKDYFIVTDPNLDLSGVTRPRALPLLTAFDTAEGQKYVWTTFSADQIDLNFSTPDVLLEVTELLLYYVGKGANLIRLDAIGYLWKEFGTNCIHLPQTHAVVQLWRSVLDILAPNTILITETNVPHKDNVSYFGDGTNEAQLVYQFPLVPLVLNALHSGNAQHLQNWAATLQPPTNQTTFFNFLASHDGIGVVPAKGILSETEVQGLVDTTLKHGGRVSYKNNPDGSQSPYELNITWFDALSDPNDTNESLDTKVDRFLASQAILLSLQGMPGIYFHSLFGSENWQEGWAQTGRARTINRQKLQYSELEAALADPESRASKVFYRYTELIQKRTAQKAFHPNAAQQILALHPTLFTLLRSGGGEQILVIINVSGNNQNLTLTEFGGSDLVSGKKYQAGAVLELQPYQVLWLKS